MIKVMVMSVDSVASPSVQHVAAALWRRCQPAVMQQQLLVQTLLLGCPSLHFAVFCLQDSLFSVIHWQ
jgi:hypothetical protein